jgi:antitoxin component of RelBE/YafQ-DinJ toxin-antitoxin module
MHKQEYLQVRIDADEKKAFADAAELAGIPVSAWVRERLRQCATRELEAASQTVAFLKNRKGA